MQSVYLSKAPADCTTFWGESYLSAEMQSVYSTVPADCTTHWGSLFPLQRCNQCILQHQPTVPLVGETFPSAEMQSVYSTVPADCTTHWGSLFPLQRCNQCILQSQPTAPLIGGVFSLCRDAISVFYSTSRLHHSLGESFPSAEMQSVYSTAPADCTTHWGSLFPLQRCNQCILQSQPTTPLIGGVFSLCRDAISVFYSPSRLHHSLGESFPSAEMQSVYSTAPADCTTHWGSLFPLQRCNQCILQHQPTAPLVGETFPSAEMQSVYSTVPADCTTHWGSLFPLQRCNQCILQSQPTAPLVGGVLSLCSDAISVFYTSCRLRHSLGESYPSAAMPSVYSTLPVDYATRWGRLFPLQRCNLCILMPQLVK